MPRWSAALNEAGITDPTLRRAYGTQREQVRTYAFHPYLAARLLLPARLLPSVVAMVAFMHATDDRIDTGDPGTRHKTLSAWDRQVRAALDTDGSAPAPGPGTSDAALLQTLADTARRHGPHLTTRVHDFLNGAPTEADFTGFDTEADFQAYIDSYALPALMLTASLIAPAPESGKDEGFRQGCRALIEGWQRSDFLADLPEDTRQGRIGIARDELARHGLTPADLHTRPARCHPALERLLGTQADLAEAALRACRELPELVQRPYRPFLRALICVQDLQLQAVRRKGSSLLHDGAHPPTAATLRVLAAQYAAAKTRQHRTT
ncbi:squalene/phytoene synthase family protein [Streptomyces coerulescens]|uniref:Squalene/phytoene synthase family protein n=1 Tax=Streptomyces coerulescens TaxID=29304 RepID=A0ABW0D024_STRCD